MTNKQLWQDVLAPSTDEQVWELLHENSKIGAHSYTLSNEEVRARMSEYHEALPYEGYPLVQLSTSRTALPMPLDQAIVGRTSARHLTPVPLGFQDVGTLLHYAYGVTRDNHHTTFPRPFRVVPSGGALYPLELYFYSGCVEGRATGLYHYNPTQNHVRLLREGDAIEDIAGAVIQPEIVRQCSLLIFITSVFERSVIKYGERGYRFILIEAGHVAQNINLVATALALGSVNIGGFLDRKMDTWLGLDGLTHSTLYLVAIGGLSSPS